MTKKPVPTVNVAIDAARELEDDDDEGLEFIDPVAMSKAKIAKAATNKDDN